MKIGALSHLGDRLREHVVVEPPKLIGVYLLLLGEEIVYIGKSINIDARLRAHRYGWYQIDYDHVYWIPLREDQLDAYEGALIRRLAPRFNVNGTTPAETDAVIIEELRLPLASPEDYEALRRRKHESAAVVEARRCRP